MSELYTVSQANALIDAGKRMHIAGDEAVLAHLNKGAWIGGTIPYFVTRDGGVTDRSRVLVTKLPESIPAVETALLGKDELAKIPGEAPQNGFSLVILPGMTDILAAYALSAERLPKLYEKPVAGWVSGVHLDDIGKVKPKVVNGKTGEISDDRLVVLHASLPATQIASVGILNVFQQGTGDTIVFSQTDFSGDDCLVNGAKASFFDYAKETNLDLRLPLVTNRSGEMINVCIQLLDEASHTAKFLAPVEEGREYRHAAPLADYREALAARAEELAISPVFSCNCILNYLYGELEGKTNIAYSGPATFGEIAYVLLNQTLVYLTINAF
jgi:hypothetical protein